MICCAAVANVVEPLVVTTTLDAVATALPICLPPSMRITVSPDGDAGHQNCSSLLELELFSEVMPSLLLEPVSDDAIRLIPVGAAGSMNNGTICVSGVEFDGELVDAEKQRRHARPLHPRRRDVNVDELTLTFSSS